MRPFFPLKIFIPLCFNVLSTVPPACSDLLDENITKSYKKAQPGTVQAIHAENKNIATKLDTDYRVDKTTNKEVFITLRD